MVHTMGAYAEDTIHLRGEEVYLLHKDNNSTLGQPRGKLLKANCYFDPDVLFMTTAAVGRPINIRVQVK